MIILLPRLIGKTLVVGIESVNVVDFVKWYMSMNFVSGGLIHTAFSTKCRAAHLTLSDPTSDLVRRYDFPLPLRCRVTSDTFFCCVCAPAPLSEPVRRFSSCSTDFSQQIAQVVLFLFLGRYAVGRKIGLERVNCADVFSTYLDDPWISLQTHLGFCILILHCVSVSFNILMPLCEVYKNIKWPCF